MDIQTHGIRQTDFIEIHGDGVEADEEPLREMVDLEQMGEPSDETADQEDMTTGLAGLKNNFFDGQFYSDDESDNDFGDD